jgi:uncharacterized membrane protein YedE/YeeE
MRILMALITGLVFGIGLLVAGMTNPAKVLGFLDLAGRWDPSLALVMAGAILVALPAFRIAARRRQSLLGEPMHLPTATRIDRRLVLGTCDGRGAAAHFLRRHAGGHGHLRTARTTQVLTHRSQEAP